MKIEIGEEFLKQLLSHGNIMCQRVDERCSLFLEKEITPEKLHELADWWKLRHKKVGT